MSRKSERTRQRIVDASNLLFYHKGYHNSSFTDVVNTSGVPRGNIYYYFKSKEEILLAVIQHRLTGIEHRLQAWNEHYRTPHERLHRIVEVLTEYVDEIVQYGCPMATLNAELGKNDPELQIQARTLFQVVEDWLTDQFAELGYAGRARELARRLLARGEGIAMMGHVYRDKAFVLQETALLQQWIDTLAQGNAPDAA